jgi:hypothetical protein
MIFLGMLIKVCHMVVAANWQPLNSGKKKKKYREKEREIIL